MAYYGDPFRLDPDDICRKCGGNQAIPAAKSSVMLGPDIDYLDGDYIVCPHCAGTGIEPLKD